MMSPVLFFTFLLHIKFLVPHFMRPGWTWEMHRGKQILPCVSVKPKWLASMIAHWPLLLVSQKDEGHSMPLIGRNMLRMSLKGSEKQWSLQSLRCVGTDCFECGYHRLSSIPLLFRSYFVRQFTCFLSVLCLQKFTSWCALTKRCTASFLPCSSSHLSRIYIKSL